MGIRGRPADAVPRDTTWLETVHRAFEEFLAVPTVVIGGFVLLAGLTWYLDQHAGLAHDPVRAYMSTHLFGRAETTANLLGIVAAGLFTVTSIIISLLIVAIQASAAAMSTAIFDQFLRRRQNQLYFGFFVGVALFSLLTLATTHEHFNPVYGGLTCIVLSVVALYLLILLLYTTVDQMRPQVVVSAIQGHAAASHARQRDLLCRTRRGENERGGRPVISRNEGYVVAIDLDVIEQALRDAPGARVHLTAAIGSFVSERDPVARVEGAGDDAIERAVLRAVRLAHQRDISVDAAFAIQQIETIGWTAISSAKSNPLPGYVAMRAIRELIARWSRDQVDTENARTHASLAISYPEDPYGALFDALETFGAAAAESKQPQTIAELLVAVAEAYDSVPESWRPRLDQVVFRVLTTTSDHLPSVRLETALRTLVSALRDHGRLQAADATARALDAVCARARGDARQPVRSHSRVG
jgi:uncharacterized membrane protein